MLAGSQVNLLFCIIEKVDMYLWLCTPQAYMHVTYIYLHTEHAYKENILLCAMRVHDVTCGTVRRRRSSRRSRCPVRERIQNWKKCFCRNRLPYSIFNTYMYNNIYTHSSSLLLAFFSPSHYVLYLMLAILLVSCSRTLYCQTLPVVGKKERSAKASSLHYYCCC